MKNIIFKEGDLVYDLCTVSIEIHKVSKLNNLNPDKIMVHDSIFWNNGKYYSNEPYPSLIPANKETYEALKIIYPNRYIQKP